MATCWCGEPATVYLPLEQEFVCDDDVPEDEQ